MNSFLINAWATTVKSTDKIIHLGDVVFKGWSMGRLKDLLSRMPGYKILILGNHDRRNSVAWWLEAGFDEVYPYPVIYENRYILSHEPVLFAPKVGIPNLHGHMHNAEHHNLELSSPLFVNCCVEVIGYKPVLLTSVLPKSL
jgi:calcineurin-like phosphoesterase family protein